MGLPDKMSFLTMRPLGPLPVKPLKLTFFSSANFFANEVDELKRKFEEDKRRIAELKKNKIFASC